MKIRIAPSLLSADYGRFADEVRMVEEAGADLIHVDIMDGHFVPSLTFGPGLVSALKKIASLPLDVHLMVENPSSQVPKFIEAGADWISVHLEATHHLHKEIAFIKEKAGKAGIALNPATPIHLLNEIIREVDFVMILCVNPGWGGQKFIPSSHDKIRRLKSWMKGQNLDIPIEVDGGVSLENMESLIRDGAEIFVAGAAVFHQPQPRDVIARMKEISGKFNQP